MSNTTTYVVQTFELRRGRLVPGAREVASTDYGAMKKAEAVAKRSPGTAALRIVADDETGEIEVAELLGRWGEMPEDYLDQLRGG